MMHVKALVEVPRVRKNKGPKKQVHKTPAGKIVRVGFGKYRIIK